MDSAEPGTETLNWISTREARDLVRSLTPDPFAPIPMLVKYAAHGDVRTRAGILRDPATDERYENMQLPKGFWVPMTGPKPRWPNSADWAIGTLSGPVGRVQHRAHNVQFCSNDLSKILGEVDPVPKAAPLTAPPGLPVKDGNPGGKASDKHGEPIARVTIYLMGLSDADLAREKGETLIPTLKVHYRNANAVPPSAKNIEGIAWGILRAVREARKDAE